MTFLFWLASFATIMSFYALGYWYGRRVERIRLQPQLDRANKLDGNELGKVIAFAYRFADDEANLAGRYSPTLLRFLRELEGKRK